MCNYTYLSQQNDEKIHLIYFFTNKTGVLNKTPICNIQW